MRFFFVVVDVMRGTLRNMQRKIKTNYVTPEKCNARCR